MSVTRAGETREGRGEVRATHETSVLKQPEEIIVLSVDVSADLDRRLTETVDDARAGEVSEREGTGRRTTASSRANFGRAV